jgi:hypothetical protein
MIDAPVQREDGTLAKYSRFDVALVQKQEELRKEPATENIER